MDNTSVLERSTTIASTAIVAKSAKIGSNVRIGHYAIVEEDTVIGDDCVLGAHSIVRRFALLKERVFVDSFAVVGGDNQDRKFDSHIRSGVIIGADTQIREGVTIHRASYEGQYTVVGDNCLLMSNSHIAHDCVLGNDVILANNALLAGHIHADSHCILSGGACFHQFIRIGQYAMVSGNAAIAFDVPPFTLSVERNELHGLNVVGLRRAGFTNEDLQDLKHLYRLILATPGNPVDLAAKIRDSKAHGQTSAGQLFLKFFEEESKRGFLRAL